MFTTRWFRTPPSSFALRRSRRSFQARPGVEHLEGRINPVDVGDTMSLATITGLTSSTPYSNTNPIGDGIHTTRDVDMYRFSASSGQSLTAVTTLPVGGVSMDTILRLFNASGTQLAINDDDNPPNRYSRITFNFTSTATYYIGVSGYNNRSYNPSTGGSGVAGSTGDYRLSLTLSGGVDSTPPTVVTRLPSAGSTLTASSVNIEVTFSETVVGVDASDLVLTGTAASGATKGTPTNTTGNTWRFPVSGLVNGTLNISLAPDVNDIEDAAGNDLSPRPTTWSYSVAIVDSTPPTVTARTPVVGSTLTTNSVNINVTFSEAVFGVDASDLVLSGTAAASASKGVPTNITGNTWRFPVANLVSGTLNISLAPDINDIEDAVGNDLSPRPTTWSYPIVIGGQTVQHVIVSADDSTSILDPIVNRLHRFTRTGTADSTFGAFSRYQSLAAFGGILYAADALTDNIDRYRPDGRSLGTLVDTTGLLGSGASLKNIEFDTAGNLYAAPAGFQSNARTSVRFNSSGVPTASFSHADLVFPEGIDADASGNVYIVNGAGVGVGVGNRLFKFNSSGTFVNSFAISQVNSPGDLAIDSTNQILYIADESSGNIKSYNIATATPSFLNTINVPGLSNIQGFSFDAGSGNLFATGGGLAVEVTTSGVVVNSYSGVNTLVAARDVAPISWVILDVGDTLTTAAATNLGPSPGSYSNDTQIGDSTLPSKDVDMYRFDVQVGSRITATTSLPPGGLRMNDYLRLFDSAGNQVAFTDQTQLVHTFTSAGTFYLGVSGNGNNAYNPTAAGSGTSGQTGDYRLSLTLVDVDLPPQVTTLNPADGAVVAATAFNVDVTFSEPVVGVDASDLVLSGAAAAAGPTVGAPTDQGGNTWRFPVNGLVAGALAISLAPDVGDIRDATGNDLAPRPTQWTYTVLTPPVVQAEPDATPGTSNTIQWNAVASADGYYAEYDTSTGFPSPDGNSGWVSGLSHTFQGLTTDQTYSYRVKARKVIPGATDSWTQTTQADFAADVLTNVSATISPNNVVLTRGGPVEVAGIISNPSFEDPGSSFTIPSWTTTFNASNNMLGSTVTTPDGIMPTAGTQYFRVHTLNQTSLSTGDYRGVSQSVDLTNLNEIRFDAELTAPATWENRVRGEVRIDGTVVWSRSAFGSAADQSINVSAYTGAHTLELRSFVSSGGFFSSQWVAFDDLRTFAPGPYSSSGSITSTPITPAPLHRWGTLSFQATTPAGTSLTVDVLNSAGGVLASNVTSGSNLDSLGIVASSIKLRANLSTTDTTATPVLHDWMVTWQETPDSYVESDWSNVVSSTQDATAPSVSSLSPVHGSTLDQAVINVDVMFSEAVSGVDATDLVLSGGAAGGASVGAPTDQGGNTWRFPISGLVSGTLNLSLAPDADDIEDRVGNDLNPRPTTWSYTIDLNQPPIPDAGGPYSVREGHSRMLDASNTSDPDQSADSLTYKWDLDNDGVYGETGAAASHGDETGVTPTFLSGALDGPGSWTVRLRVTDNEEVTREDDAVIDLLNGDPSASFGNNGPVEAGSPVTVSFTNPTDPSLADRNAGFRYSYDFNNDGDFTDPGDLVDSADASRSITFSQPGTHTVHGRVTDKDGGYTDYRTPVIVDPVPVDVSALVSLVRGGVRYNRVTGRYVQTVTLTNLSGRTLTGPISLVLDNLTSGVQLHNKTGTTVRRTPSGSPYLDVLLGDFAAGQTLNVVLEFVNPQALAISYTTRVFAGPGRR